MRRMKSAGWMQGSKLIAEIVTEVPPATAPCEPR